MNKSIMKKIIFFIILILMLVSSVQTYAMTIDPNEYKPGDLTDNDTKVIVSKFGILVDVIRTIGIIVTVVVLLILGIKYMAGSITEKADYKKSMIPYLIGVALFFSLTQVLSIIMGIAGNIEW